MNKNNLLKYKNMLVEGLRFGDMADMVYPTFGIDQYKSKMGEDQDIVVVTFKVKDKMAAMDLMEFIEKGYRFVLDADMSSGEESDGNYSVFVELERNTEVPRQIMLLLDGLEHLTDCAEWDFYYYKDSENHNADLDTLKANIPLVPEEYEGKLLGYKNNELSEFFNQGTVEVALDENNIIKFNKPFAGILEAKLETIGLYDTIKNSLPGKISLDENSQSQVLFLNKFLGNYDIHKVEQQFLIRNGNKAVILSKERW